MEKFGLSHLIHSQENARSNRAVATTLLGIQNGKKVNKILLISKEESIELQKLGHKFGSDGNLHKSKNKHPKYYLTESKKALIDLEKIRKSKIVAR